MKLYEYQAKERFRQAGIETPRGEVASTPAEVRAAAERLGPRVAVKVQVPIGGRGKAGGIKLAQSPEEAETIGQQLIGMNVRGYVARQVLVEEAVDIQAEYYLGITVDRAEQANVVIFSSEGGMDVEEIAEEHPDKISKLWIDESIGLRDFHIRHLVAEAGLDQSMVPRLAPVLRRVYQIFKETDASLVEINPLAEVGPERRLVALDGKIEIDENALFRQKELAQLREAEGDHPLERKARELGLAYVKLDGEVGIIGNGAGLVMTTLDMIQRSGGRAANFLDIGGGARAEVVRNALDIVLADPDVRSVLINVFGGITRCDEVAKGLLEVLREVGVRVPLVVRLVGTREEEARRLLAEADLGGAQLVPAATFQEAAQRAVELARG